MVALVNDSKIIATFVQGPPFLPLPNTSAMSCQSLQLFGRCSGQGCHWTRHVEGLVQLWTPVGLHPVGPRHLYCLSISSGWLGGHLTCLCLSGSGFPERYITGFPERYITI